MTKTTKNLIFFFAALAVLIFTIFSCNKTEIEDIKPQETVKVQSLLSSPGPVNAVYPTVRGIYLDKTDTIYNNPTGRAVFAKYCKDNKFIEVDFYSIAGIMASSSKYPNMAQFNKELKNAGVVKRFPVMGSSSTTNFANFRAYTTDSTKRFNGLNFELEFWNNASTAATWTTSLDALNTYADSKSPDLNNTFYMGWFKNLGTYTDSSLARKMLDESDWIDLHIYQDNKASYSYSRSRLEAVAKAAKAKGVLAHVHPIISTEQISYGAQNDFQGNLLALKGYAGIEKMYIDDYNLNASTDVKTWIRIDYFKYFTKRYCYQAIPPK